MGTINISTGANGRGTFSYTVTYSPAGALTSRNPRYLRLWIRGRRNIMIVPSSSQAGETGSATFSGTNQDLAWLRECSKCSWVPTTYRIETYYQDPVNGFVETQLIETGNVVISGPTGCSECEEGGPGQGPAGQSGTEEEDGQSGGGGGGENPDYGPAPPAFNPELPKQPDAPSAPCLPPPTVPPILRVPTPCSSGGGGGSGATGFG